MAGPFDPDAPTAPVDDATRRRDLKKFWLLVGALVAIGLLFVWWSSTNPLSP